MDTKKSSIFWGAFVVYNKYGKLIEKGEIYSPPTASFPKLQLCVSQKGIINII